MRVVLWPDMTFVAERDSEGRNRSLPRQTSNLRIFFFYYYSTRSLESAHERADDFQPRRTQFTFAKGFFSPFMYRLLAVHARSVVNKKLPLHNKQINTKNYWK